MRSEGEAEEAGFGRLPVALKGGEQGPSLCYRAAMTPPCVILDKPQLAENIGAVARVMANFGLYDLRLVSPRDGWPQDRAWASASGANWPLDDAKVFSTVGEAVGDLELLYATTARPRETQLPILTAREAAANLSTASAEGLKVGLLFGAERAGLETADLALSNGIVTIPVDPRFHSLNLAQAVSITAYEWRLTVMDAPASKFRDMPPPAAQAAMIGLYEHLETELETSGFFFPPENKPSMVRNLRVALGRARFTDQETAHLPGGDHSAGERQGTNPGQAGDQGGGLMGSLSERRQSALLRAWGRGRGGAVLIVGLLMILAPSLAMAAPARPKAVSAPAPSKSTPIATVQAVYAALPRPTPQDLLSRRLRVLVHKDDARRERHLDFEWRSGRTG